MLKFKYAAALSALFLLVHTLPARAEQSCGFLNVAYAFNSPSPEQCVAQAVNQALLNQSTAEGWELSELGYSVEVRSVRRNRGRNFTFHLSPPPELGSRIPNLQGWVRMNSLRPYLNQGYDCSINIGVDPEIAQTNLIIQNETGTRLIVLGQERMPVCSMQ